MKQRSNAHIDEIGMDPPKDHPVKQQEGNARLIEDQQNEEIAKHPLSIWTTLAPGDVASFHLAMTGECVGTVETRTSDGLIIWVRDDLNERRLFHFHDCQSVRLLR
ncbi:hypothetical protein GCM10023346_31560 [Arthrobacter gyeryongensis]|uniref:Uncharacterized protein n=1 Tax=Arthrobacter gyeryongensis TaxID=1650592 RepID=A0ABP9SK60_9MICC